MTTFREVFAACLPIAEAWLTDVVAGAVSSAIAAEREKEKPSRNYSRDEVCQLLHVSKPTLWEKTRKGAISSIKVGRRVLYAEKEVKRVLEGGWKNG